MAIRNLTKWNDPLFDKVSKPVVRFDDRLWTLLDDMLDTLKLAGGYGCAAVHVGILRRAVLINDIDGIIELINPKITETSAETQSVLEGSIAAGAPLGYVERPKTVTVSAADRNGEPTVMTCHNFLAATLCHEIDHLDGIRFSSKASRLVSDKR